jgi:N-acetylglucosamine malate deacetylase 2
MQKTARIKKRKTIAAIFAHPDDEAFGPSGTLAKLSRNYDVYLLCATRGEMGGTHNKLAQIRSRELKESAKILGIKKVYFLGFLDGTLSNNLYHVLAEKIEKRLKILKPQTIMTFEPRGISGHIDHVAVSLVTTFVFYKLPFIKKLLYYCIGQDERRKIDNYFIYFPPGYKSSEIDKTVKIEDVWDKKVKAMFVHKSQIHDAKRILKMLKILPKEEHFLEVSK